MVRSSFLNVSYLRAKCFISRTAVYAGEEEAVQFFNDWHEMIVASVPAEKLVIYNVKEGWGPLAGMLDMEVPQVELLMMNRPSCTITEKAPTIAFSWLKAATTPFTFKNLRHYAKRALIYGKWVANTKIIWGRQF